MIARSSLPAVDQPQRPFHTLRRFDVEDRSFDGCPFLELPDALEVDRGPSSDADPYADPDNRESDVDERSGGVAAERHSASNASRGLVAPTRERSAGSADDSDESRFLHVHSVMPVTPGGQ